MSLDATGKPREYIRLVGYPCSTCRNPQMGIVSGHDGCLTLECPKCDSGAHVFTKDLPLEDQGTPQAEAALARLERVREKRARAAKAEAEANKPLEAKDLL